MSGMRLAAGVEEALEQQVVLERVDVGDAQRVGDDAAGRRTAPGSDGDAVVLGELHEVPDDEEVGVEAHLADDAELEVEAFAHLGAGLGAVAARDALLAQVAQVARPRCGRRAPGSVGSSSRRSRARRRSARRSRPWQSQALGIVGEALAHLVAGLEVELVGAHSACGSRLVEQALRLDAEQRVVGVGVLVAQVVDVVGGHRPEAGLRGQQRELGQRARAARRGRRPAARRRRSRGRTARRGARSRPSAAASLPSRSSSEARPLMQPVRR